MPGITQFRMLILFLWLNACLVIFIAGHVILKKFEVPEIIAVSIGLFVAYVSGERLFRRGKPVVDKYLPKKT